MKSALNAYIDMCEEVAENAPMAHSSANAAVSQWQAALKGANVGALMSHFYPATENTVSETVRTSVQLTREQHEDIGVIAELWNELDKAFGKKRRRKWSDAAVIARLLTVGIDGFWAQVGGRPAGDKDRREFIAQAADRIRKSTPKK